MPELTLRDQIKKLVALQKVDAEIYSLRDELKEKPQQIQALKEDFDKEKEKLNALEDTLKKIQLDRKEKELELQTKEGDIGKANSQLLQIKTNKEYTAKINEIESIKADKSQIEEKVLLFYEEADKVRAEAEEEKKVVAEKEKKYLADKKKIDDEINGLEKKIRDCESQRKDILPEINPNYLNRYEQLLSNRNGSAIVAVHSGSCGGCNMNLTAQMINALKMEDQLVECDTCSRILYLEEEIE